MLQPAALGGHACLLLACHCWLKHPACNRPCPTLPPVQMGLDLIEGSIRDNVAAGVVEPALSKTKIIQFATEAVRGGPTLCGTWCCLLGWERLHCGQPCFVCLCRRKPCPLFAAIALALDSLLLPITACTVPPRPAGHHHPAH